MQHEAGEAVTAQHLNQWIEEHCRVADPVRQCRAFEVDAFTCIDRGLPVEREMVGIFSD